MESADQAETAMAAYFAACRARVVPFVDRHFSWQGSWRIHRHALGWDLLRTPVNVFLVLPMVLAKLAAVLAVAAGARRLAAWLERLDLLLPTAVAGHIDKLVRTELLCLPDPSGNPGNGPATGEAGEAEPQATATGPADRAACDGGLPESLAVYRGTRTAASEIATAGVTLAAGAVTLQKLTPGAMTLAPGLAALVATQTAVAGFPLGATLGGLWYGIFPPDPPVWLVIGVFCALLPVAALVGTFAGLVADPVQRWFGLHRRRLHRLIDTLEARLQGDGTATFRTGDAYVARVFDIADVAAAVARHLR